MISNIIYGDYFEDRYIIKVAENGDIVGTNKKSKYYKG